MRIIQNYFFVFFIIFLSLKKSFSKPPINIPPRNPNDPVKLSNGVNKSVLIIGGGLAGLSAALELADRG